MGHQFQVLGQALHEGLASLNSSAKCVYTQLVVLQSDALSAQCVYTQLVVLQSDAVSAQCVHTQLVVLQSDAALAITPVVVVIDFQHHFHFIGCT